MITAVVLLAAGCLNTSVENRTSEWTRRDDTTLAVSQKRCEAKFPDSPCVKLFRKHSFQGYHVVCSNLKD